VIPPPSGHSGKTAGGGAKKPLFRRKKEEIAGFLPEKMPDFSIFARIFPSFPHSLLPVEI